MAIEPDRLAGWSHSGVIPHAYAIKPVAKELPSATREVIKENAVFTCTGVINPRAAFLWKLDFPTFVS